MKTLEEHIANALGNGELKTLSDYEWYGTLDFVQSLANEFELTKRELSALQKKVEELKPNYSYDIKSFQCTCVALMNGKGEAYISRNENCPQHKTPNPN